VRKKYEKKATINGERKKQTTQELKTRNIYTGNKVVKETWNSERKSTKQKKEKNDKSEWRMFYFPDAFLDIVSQALPPKMAISATRETTSQFWCSSIRLSYSFP
jgi:hypothetical protein